MPGKLVGRRTSRSNIYMFSSISLISVMATCVELFIALDTLNFSQDLSLFLRHARVLGLASGLAL